MTQRIRKEIQKRAPRYAPYRAVAWLWMAWALLGLQQEALAQMDIIISQEAYPLCRCDVPTGALRAYPTNGVAPYSYLWNTGSTEQRITGLTAGEYSVTVTDAVGDTITGTVFLPYDCQSPGNSLAFDGIDDYVNVGNALQDAHTDFHRLTYEAWIYADELGDGYIISYEDEDGHSIVLRADNQGRLAMHFQYDPNHLVIGLTSPSNVIQTQQWHHVAMTISRGNYIDSSTDWLYPVYIRLYVDGEEVAVKDGRAGLFEFAPTGDFRIGNTVINGNSRFWKGRIDDVRVWAIRRLQSEIANARYTNLYHSNTEDLSDLIAYYDFDQGDPWGFNPTHTAAVNRMNPQANGTLENFALLDGPLTSNWAPGIVVPQGQPEQPILVVDVPVEGHDFGLVQVGDTVWRTYTVRNAGNMGMTLDAQWETASQSDWSVNFSQNDLSGEDTVYLLVGFHPSAGAGDVQENLRILGSTSYCETEEVVLNLSAYAGVLSLQPSPATCQNRADGSAAIAEFVMPNGPFQYQWSHGDTTAAAAGLAAGTYELSVTNAQGQTFVATATVEEPDTVATVQVNVVALAGCGCEATGALEVLAPADGVAPYTYAWSHGDTSGSPTELYVGHYEVEVLDASGCRYVGNKTLTHGCATDRALNFDGIDDRMAVPNPGVNREQGFTIEAWVKADGGGQNGNVIFSGLNGYQLSLTPTRISAHYIRQWDDTPVYVAEYTNTPTDRWHHVAVAFQGIYGGSSSEVTVYLNGNQVAYDYRTDEMPFPYWSITVGHTPDYQHHWRGSIDEFRVWRGVQSGDSIRARMHQELDPSQYPDLVRYYDFNQGILFGDNPGDTTAYDRTANAQHGWMNNFALSGTRSNWATGFTDAPLPVYVDFDFATTDTDFGVAVAGAGYKSKTYPIVNNGYDTLRLYVVSDHAAFVAPADTISVLPLSTGELTLAFSPSSVGDYQATISLHSNDCQLPLQSFQVSGSTVEGITAVVDQTRCAGDLGGIALQRSQAGPSYSVLWSTGSTDSLISGLDPGLYTATITLDGMDPFSQAFQIIEREQLRMFNRYSRVSCDCGGDGWWEFSEVRGGTAPYTYAWSTGSTAPFISDLDTGYYSVTITDSLGCQSTSGLSLGYDCAENPWFSYGSALSFDGLDDFVDIPNSEFYGTSGGLTVEAWIRAETLDSLEAEGTLLSVRYETAPGTYSSLDISVGGNGRVQASGLANAASPAQTIRVGKWHYLAVVVDLAAASPYTRLYVDGAIVGESAGAYLPDATPDTIFIGKRTISGDAFWRGDIDEVRIWRVARSQEEIVSNIAWPVTDAQSDLAYYFPCNNGIVAGGNNQGDYTYTWLSDWFGFFLYGTLYNFALSGDVSNWVYSRQPTFSEIDVLLDSPYLGIVPAGTTASKSIVLTNTGAGPLRISEISSDNPRFSIMSAISRIEPGDSALLEIHFSPVTDLPDTAQIVIISDDCSEGTFGLMLIGNEEFIVGSGNVTATLSASAGSTVSGPFVVDIVFSEGVQGLLPSELLVSNATLSSPAVVDPAHYQVTLTPIDGGVVAISLPADQAQTLFMGVGNEASNVLSVYFDGLASGTCIPGGGNASKEWIQRFRLLNGSTALLDNISGKNQGYGDYTGLAAPTLQAGNSYQFVFHRGIAAGQEARQQAYRIWIDYNRDGDFNDAGERAYSRNLTDASIQRGNFTVPSNAMAGLARMRVQMKYNQVPFSSCETLPFGETEDYVLRIVAPANLQASRLGQGVSKGLLEDASEASLSVYPNPASGTAQVEFSGEGTLELLSLDGRVLRHAQASGTHQLDLSGLPSGLYVISVTDAQGNRQTAKLAVE